MAIVNRHDAGVATLHQRGDLQVVQVRLVDYKNEFPGHQRWMYLAYESGTAGFVLRPFPSYKKDRVSTFVGATVAITTKAGEKSTTTWRFFSVPDAAAQAALSVAVFDRSSYADAPVLVVTPAPSATVSATATGPALR
jgi:hypothetical protein